MKKIRFLIREESGAITAMTVIMMVAFVGILGVVIDLGHVHTVQNELRNAADAAALAGARSLMPLTAPVGAPAEPPWPMEDPPPCGIAITDAIDTAGVNQTQGGAARTPITIENTEFHQDVVTGVWDFVPVGTRAGTFTPVACDMGLGTNAVQVTARMDADLSQGSVIMTFAKIFGIDTMNPSATAVAALGYLATLPEGSPGGFLAADYDFMKTAETNWKNGNKGQLYYLVLGPAGGQTNWAFADNGGWALPSGTYQGFNPTVQDYIADGTQVDITAGESIVDLKNGEMTSVLKGLQDAVIAADYALALNILGVYADKGPTTTGDAWNEKNTIVNAFWESVLTNVWTASEFKKDSNIQEILGNMYTDANAQDKLVGVIEFRMVGPAATTGAGGNPLPSNTYTLLPRLVQ